MQLCISTLAKNENLEEMKSPPNTNAQEKVLVYSLRGKSSEKGMARCDK